jgi:hypothetical protein
MSEALTDWVTVATDRGSETTGMNPPKVAALAAGAAVSAVLEARRARARVFPSFMTLLLFGDLCVGGRTSGSGSLPRTGKRSLRRSKKTNRPGRGRLGGGLL